MTNRPAVDLYPSVVQRSATQGSLLPRDGTSFRMTDLKTYDESMLVKRLSSLDRESKTAFAAACAQRLLPLFERYAQTAGRRDDPDRLSAVVSAAWRAAAGLGDEAEARRLQAAAEAMVPSDDGDDWCLELGYGQNAAAAAAYAIRTWLTDDPQEAAWAARQVYELADCAVLQGSPALDLNTADADSQVLAAAPVQEALAALEQSISTVEARPSDWQELRAAAERDVSNAPK